MSNNRTADRWKTWAKKNPEKANLRMKEWRHRNPKYMLRVSAERRAKAKGIEFDILLDDVPDIPDICPIALIPLFARDDGTRGPCDNSPTLDRVDPALGYVKGNLRIISHKANRWKNEMTREELQRVIDYVDGKI
jgi:hypothetical protein